MSTWNQARRFAEQRGCFVHSIKRSRSGVVQVDLSYDDLQSLSRNTGLPIKGNGQPKVIEMSFGADRVRYRASAPRELL